MIQDLIKDGAEIFLSFFLLLSLLLVVPFPPSSLRFPSLACQLFLGPSVPLAMALLQSTAISLSRGREKEEEEKKAADLNGALEQEQGGGRGRKEGCCCGGEGHIIMPKTGRKLNLPPLFPSLLPFLLFIPLQRLSLISSSLPLLPGSLFYCLSFFLFCCAHVALLFLPPAPMKLFQHQLS